MNVKRTYPCFHDGKTYGTGEIVDVDEEIARRWIKSGSAELHEVKLEMDTGTPATKMTDEEKFTKAQEDAKAAAAEKNKDREKKGPDYFYTQETFKDLGWVNAQEISFAMYQVKDKSWDNLWEEFSAAQLIAWSEEE